MRLLAPAFLLLGLIPSALLPGQHLSSDEQSRDTLRLDEVVVSVLPFNQTYQESAGGVFTLKPASLGLTQLINTTAVFNLVPGVYMAAGTYNTNRLVIRGVGSRTPYNTNRIKAYLDDIPLTSGDGVSTLEDQDLHAIGQMEILKGPASSLYGSGLGGVVRLSSPYPVVKGFSASANSEAGSFGTRLYGVNTSYKNRTLAITGGMTRTVSAGYRDNSEYQRTNAFMHLKAFGIRHTFALTLSLVDLLAQIPSSLNESDYLNEPWRAGGSWGIIEGFEEYVRLLSGASLESNLGKGFTNKLVVFSTYSDPYESRPFNILDDRSTNLGFREIVQLQRRNWKYSAGMEYFHEWVDWKVYETEGGVQASLLNHQKEKRQHLNAFLFAQWRPSENWVVDGGLNLNLLSYTLQTLYRVDSSDQSGQYRYNPVLSPRLGISFQHHPNHYLYASAGHGFSAPSLEETLLPEGAINTELRPEIGWNLELGNRGKLFKDRLHYDLTLYTVLLDDLLVTERLSEDIFTGANAGKALNSGLELWTNFFILDQPVTGGKESTRFVLKATISCTLSRNRFTDFVDDGISYTGKSLPGIPAQLLNAMLTGRWHLMELKLHFQHEGSQWMDDLNSQTYAGHQLLHLQAGWNLRFREDRFSIRLTAGIKNILNAKYASMILVNAPSFGASDPRYYYPGLPRQYHLGISLRFNRQSTGAD